MPTRRPAGPRVLEKHHRKRCCDAALSLGWTVRFIADSRKAVRRGDRYILVPDPDQAGLPDLFLFHPRAGRSMFRELKLDSEDLRPAQKELIPVMAASGLDVGVWWERDWPDKIMKELKP